MCKLAQQRKGPGGALGNPNKEQNWVKEQNVDKKETNGTFFGVWSFMKIPLVRPS